MDRQVRHGGKSGNRAIKESGFIMSPDFLITDFLIPRSPDFLIA